MSLLSKVFKRALLMRFAAVAGMLGAGSVGVLNSAENVKRVRFLHIADTHAQLDTHWEYLPEDPSRLHQMGGFARIRTALDEKRSNAPGAVFTVDGGDTFQGSAMAAWTKGEAIIAPFNALHVDVGTAGNWEVVYGPEVFRKLMGEVSEKVVCYNFEEKSSKRRLFPPSVVLEKDGVKVVFVGLTDPTTTTRQAPAEVVGLDSTRLDGLREFVQNLKRREKPDLTVLVDHTGLWVRYSGLAHFDR